MGASMGDDAGGELNVTPLLDLFVALIPFLILSAVMTKINIVNIAVSKPVSVVSKPKNSNFNLNLKVSNSEIKLLLNKKVHKSIAIDSKQEWIKNLHLALVSLKEKNPAEIEFKLEPTAKVEVEILMKIMDTARKMAPDDVEIIRKDKDTGKPVRVKYLFPKVTLRGVYT